MTRDLPKFTPLNDRVLCAPTTEPPSKGGVLLPDNSKERYWTCEVLAVGSKVEHVGPGDVVVLGRYTAVSDDINVGGRECVLVAEEALLGVVA